MSIFTLLTLTQLFRTFDLAVAKPDRPWNGTNLLVFLHKDFYIRMTPREKHEEAVPGDGKLLEIPATLHI